MQGLLNQPQGQGQMQGQPQPGQPQPGQPQPTQPSPQPSMQSPQGDNGKPTPEEQQMYETIVGQTTEYIYGQGLESVKKRLQAGAADGVEDDAGAIVGNLLAMNYQSAMQAGRTIPPKVMAGAAKELSELVIDIAVEMQLISEQEANAGADETLYVTMQTFGQTAKDMPQEEKQIYTQMIEALVSEEAQAKGGMQPPPQQPPPQSQPQGGMQPPQPPPPPQPQAAPPTMQGGMPAGTMT